MSRFPGYARGPRNDDPPSDFDWGVRTLVYGAFARSGTAPSIDDLVAFTGATPGRIKASLRKLEDAHELATDPDDGGVWMAHPFSAVTTDYPVETSAMMCHANCAWDALGVPAILGTDGWTRTKCAGSGEPIEFGVERSKVVGDADVVIHLVTPLRRVWDDIGFT